MHETGNYRQLKVSRIREIIEKILKNKKNKIIVFLRKSIFLLNSWWVYTDIPFEKIIRNTCITKPIPFVGDLYRNYRYKNLLCR